MLNRLFTPDTVNYFIAGYVVFALAIAGYLVSLALRWKKAAEEFRGLERDIQGE